MGHTPHNCRMARMRTARQHECSQPTTQLAASYSLRWSHSHPPFSWGIFRVSHRGEYFGCCFLLFVRILFVCYFVHYLYFYCSPLC